MPARVSNTVFHLPDVSSTDAIDAEDSVLNLFILPTEVDKDLFVFLSSRLNVCKRKERKSLKWLTKFCLVMLIVYNTTIMTRQTRKGRTWVTAWEAN